MTVRAWLFALGSTAVALSSAHAFAPTNDASSNAEPNRIRQYHAYAQASLAEQAAWQGFIAGEGQGWMARFDEQTGTPHRMWGTGIDLGPVKTEAQAGQAVLDFALRNSRLFGVDSSDLVVKSANYVERLDTWYVDIDVLDSGAPIWRGGLTARLKQGKLILFGADSYAGVQRVGAAVLSRDAAIHAAITAGPQSGAQHHGFSGQLVWLPRDGENGLELRLVWETRTLTDTGIPATWVSFVDAETGELLAVYDEVKHFTGQINGTHDIRNPASGTTTSALPLVRVVGGSTDYTDWSGNFTVTDAGSYSAELLGEYLRVTNDAGDEGSLSFTATSATFSTSNATQAEIDTYYFLHVVKAWGEVYAPEVGMVTESLRSNVNLDQTCNAYYDGDVNFFRSGDGCNNTGQLADVNYHEWGHGFHYYSIESGTWDGSLSEGAGDVVSALQTGDHRVSPYFFTNGGAIRDIENNNTYPEDLIGEVHEDGLIFAGAMWDLWNILSEDEGAEVGYEATAAIFTGLLKGGPTIEESYDEAVVADDDNGNLNDGTPHLCAIVEAFGRHGLGPNGGVGLVNATHTPPDIVAADEAHDIELSLVNFAPECADFVPTAGLLHYRTNGGSWETTSMKVGPEAASASLPSQGFGSFVDYYATIDSPEYDVTAPAFGIRNPFTLFEGDVIEISCEDFEATDGGYTHELVEGSNELGADDWQYGAPHGAANDPTSAHSGTRVWGNDLGEGDYNGEYQNEKHNRLVTPVVATSYFEDVFLHYWRWLNVEDGVFDNGQIHADGEQVWTNFNSGNSNSGAEHHQDRQWVPHSVNLDGAGDDGEVQISWDIVSDQALTLGGWNIDDVCFYAPATPNNRLAITDFSAGDNEDGGITLTWTNAKYGPVSKVVVVRNDTAFPTSAEDGTVVYEEENPELASPGTFRDEDVTTDQVYYYAAFATDGDAWLGWVRQGLNADDGSAFNVSNDDGDGDDFDLKKGKCGCSTPATPAAIGWTLAGLGALIAVRRRRR